MIIAAIVLFIVGAFFGLIVLSAILSNKPTPKAAVFTHGPLVASGLILVLIAVLSGNTDSLLVTSLVLFVFAALGGLTLFTIDMRNKPIPKLLAVMHPMLAVVALILLVIYAVKSL